MTAVSRTNADRRAGARRAGDLALSRGRWTQQQRNDLEADLLEEERREAALDRPDSGQDERVWVQLPADDVAFIRGFNPDRDRTASRADMVRVMEHLQDALAADVPPLARVLAEVAAEVQPGLGLTGVGWSRSELIAFAADCLTRVLAIDAAAGDR